MSKSPTVKKPTSTKPTADLGAIDPRQAAREQMKRYITAFGAEQGAKWFLADRPFDQCQAEHTAAVLKRAETAEARADRLAAERDEMSAELERVAGERDEARAAQAEAEAMLRRYRQAVGDRGETTPATFAADAAE